MRNRKGRILVVKERESEDYCKGLEVIAQEILEAMYEEFLETTEDISGFDEVIYEVVEQIDDGEDEAAMKTVYMLTLISDYRARVKLDAFVLGDDLRERCFLEYFAEYAREFYGYEE